MRVILKTIPAALFVLASCNNQSKQNQTTNADTTETAQLQTPANNAIPYVLAQNYFVKNTIGEDRNGIHKIETQAAFDELFSPAATMGKDGKPTPIDFDKQYVIAIISATSDLTPTIDSVAVEKQGEEITVTYKEVLGEKQSFSVRPVAILLVDKQYQGHLKTEIQKEI